MGRENGRSDRFKVDGPRGQHWNEREKMDDHSNLNWTVKVLSISGPSNWTGHIRSKYRSPFWQSILTEFAVQVISVRSSTIISSLKWPSSELKWTETNRTYFFDKSHPIWPLDGSFCNESGNRFLEEGIIWWLEEETVYNIFWWIGCFRGFNIFLWTYAVLCLP